MTEFVHALSPAAQIVFVAGLFTAISIAVWGLFALYRGL